MKTDKAQSSAAYHPPYDDVVEAAWQGAVGRYTVGPGNVERVIALAVDDILRALRPHIESLVEDRYRPVVWRRT